MRSTVRHTVEQVPRALPYSPHLSEVTADAFLMHWWLLLFCLRTSAGHRVCTADSEGQARHVGEAGACSSPKQEGLEL